MGQSGAVAMLILLFLAVTSACSAEQIAVSSLLTYDVYGVYINPNPSEKQILWSSHACILGYSLFMGAIATAFNYIGVSMGYLYELMGTMIGSAVVPIALCITWNKCNGTGAVVGAIVGFCAAIAGWIGLTARLNGGVVNVDTTFGDYEMLTGNLLAIGIGGIITVGWSLVRPANFDWDITRAINAKPDNEVTRRDGTATPPQEDSAEAGSEAEKKGDRDLQPEAAASPDVDAEEQPTLYTEDNVSLQKAFRFASWSAIALTVILIIVSLLPERTFGRHPY
jgi:nitrate reductase gamma subunit